MKKLRNEQVELSGDGRAAVERTPALRVPTAPLGSDWLTRRPDVHGDVVDALLKERDEGR